MIWGNIIWYHWSSVDRLAWKIWCIPSSSYLVAGINNRANIDPHIPVIQQIPRKTNLGKSSFAIPISIPCILQLHRSSRVPSAVRTIVNKRMLAVESVTILTTKCQHDKDNWQINNNRCGASWSSPGITAIEVTGVQCCDITSITNISTLTTWYEALITKIPTSCGIDIYIYIYYYYHQLSIEISKVFKYSQKKNEVHNKLALINYILQVHVVDKITNA